MSIAFRSQISPANLYANHLLQSASLTTLQILSITFRYIRALHTNEFTQFSIIEIGNTCGKKGLIVQKRSVRIIQHAIMYGSISAIIKLTRICEISLQQASKTTRGPRHVLWQTDTRSSSVVTPLKPVTR